MAPGTRLGPYEIISLIGAGGMGAVYKATDTRLGRVVALKVSQTEFSKRFEREASAIAVLNHPHICTLYDVGPDYLVMEHIEGKPIAGPLPIDEAVTIAGQILDALEEAHRNGITHRDLKPGNILLGRNGVKVLDFGLAKLNRLANAPGDATLTMPITNEGSILGTLQYMSPEQIEGKEADARSDIFAFGVLLFELISGQRPFTGKTQANLLASILKDQPRSLNELQPLTPLGLDRLVRTCLEKDPERRWQSTREIKHALEWSTQTGADPQSTVATAAVKKFNAWPVVAGAVGVIAIAALAVTYWRPPAAPAETVRLQIPLPQDTSFSTAGLFAISPDGKKLVFSALGKDNVTRLWLRSLDAVEAKPIEGTVHDPRRGNFFWSPDSRHLVFGTTAKLVKIDTSDGNSQDFAQLPDSSTGSWSKDGTVLVGTPDGIRKVEANGTSTLVTSVDASRLETFHGYPVALPDGRHFLYVRLGGNVAEAGLYVGSLDAAPAGQDRKRVLASLTQARYVDVHGGELLFTRL
jgi:eukaryotic-like serine/threonine-protein kinase